MLAFDVVIVNLWLPKSWAY